MSAHGAVRWVWRDGSVGASLARAALLPAAALYRLATLARNAAYDAGALPAHYLPLPSVGVGNLAVGGSGKTPLAGFIAAGLTRRGARPAVLLRGYGGDEAALYGIGVIVEAGADRHASAARAAARGATALVLDDCLQRRDVLVDVMLGVVAAETWSGDRWPLPAGPWREGPAALFRADVLVVTRKAASARDAELVAAELAPRTGGLAVVADLALSGLSPLAGGGALPMEFLAGRDVLAVSGVGEPDAFARQLAAAGARVEALAFGDHHAYGPADVAAVVARAAGRTVVTTAKDAVKMRALWPAAGAGCLVAELAVRPGRGAEVLEAVLDRVADAARPNTHPQAARPLADP